MVNFSEEIPEVHNGNGDGNKKEAASPESLEKNRLRATLARLQEDKEAVSEEITRLSDILETVSRGPLAIGEGADLASQLENKKTLLNLLLQKEREILRELEN